jgi:hypothetical protein
MKVIFLILFITCCASKLSVFGQIMIEKNMCNKEALEIAYISDCIKTNRRVDSLIEWKLSSKQENLISYKYKRDRLVFFELHKDTKGEFLKSIDYYHRSFQKMIFINDRLAEYEINNQTQFRVWMSKDKLSVYFCMINPDNLKMWVLTNGNTVYTSHSSL